MSHPEICPDCQGTGAEETSTRYGGQSETVACFTCDGCGYVPPDGEPPEDVPEESPGWELTGHEDEGDTDEPSAYRPEAAVLYDGTPGSGSLQAYGRGEDKC